MREFLTTIVNMQIDLISIIAVASFILSVILIVIAIRSFTKVDKITDMNIENVVTPTETIIDVFYFTPIQIKHIYKLMDLIEDRKADNQFSECLSIKYELWSYMYKELKIKEVDYSVFKYSLNVDDIARPKLIQKNKVK